VISTTLTCQAESDNLRLPDLGSASRATFSTQQEDVLSLAFLEAIYTQADLNEDPELNTYIRSIGARLLRHTHTNRKFHFYVINDNSINAFAGPGGIIAIHSGLIMAAQTEDELAAVMAHEIQHVQQEHLSRMFDQSKKGMLPMLAGIVGALLVGSQSPQAAMAMITGTIAYGAQKQLAFSRDHEWEADRFGIDTLTAAGYNPEAMADFFETLGNRYRNDAKSPEILLSHPVTDKRIADSRSRARTKTRQKYNRDNITLRMMQQRLTSLSQTPQEASNIPSCYQKRINAWLKQTPTASENCQTLPQHWLSDLIRLQTDTVQNREQRWQQLLDLYPNNQAILMRRADELFEQQRYQETIQLLMTKVDTINENWALWQKIARSWHELNDGATESWALSKAYGSIGHLKLSRIQIDKAERERTASHTPHLAQLIEKQANWLSEQEASRKSLE
jgi:predicted Zn-dependent protease